MLFISPNSCILWKIMPPPPMVDYLFAQLVLGKHCGNLSWGSSVYPAPAYPPDLYCDARVPWWLVFSLVDFRPLGKVSLERGPSWMWASPSMRSQTGWKGESERSTSVHPSLLPGWRTNVTSGLRFRFLMAVSPNPEPNPTFPLSFLLPRYFVTAACKITDTRSCYFNETANICKDYPVRCKHCRDRVEYKQANKRSLI